MVQSLQTKERIVTHPSNGGGKSDPNRSPRGKRRKRTPSGIIGSWRRREKGGSGFPL